MAPAKHDGGQIAGTYPGPHHGMRVEHPERAYY